jgi:hypothetical protein
MVMMKRQVQVESRQCPPTSINANAALFAQLTTFCPSLTISTRLDIERTHQHLSYRSTRAMSSRRTLTIAANTLIIVFGASFALSVAYPYRPPMFSILQDSPNSTAKERQGVYLGLSSC